MPAHSLPLIVTSTPPVAGAVADPVVRRELALLAAAPVPLRHRVFAVRVTGNGLTVRLRGGPLVYFGDSLLPHAKWMPPPRSSRTRPRGAPAPSTYRFRRDRRRLLTTRRRRARAPAQRSPGALQRSRAAPQAPLQDDSQKTMIHSRVETSGLCNDACGTDDALTRTGPLHNVAFRRRRQTAQKPFMFGRGSI